MAFDEQLADRVRKALGRRSGIVEKKMFGGLAFLLNGNMSVGVGAPRRGSRRVAAEEIARFAQSGC
jgi:hypothetical protein